MTHIKTDPQRNLPNFDNLLQNVNLLSLNFVYHNPFFLSGSVHYQKLVMLC